MVGRERGRERDLSFVPNQNSEQLERGGGGGSRHKWPKLKLDTLALINSITYFEIGVGAVGNYSPT